MARLIIAKTGAFARALPGELPQRRPERMTTRRRVLCEESLRCRLARLSEAQGDLREQRFFPFLDGQPLE